MCKKLPPIIALFIALLLPAELYSQKASPSATPKAASDAVDYSSLPPARIIDKLQGQIIDWQDEVIKGMEDQPIVQIIYRDMGGIAVDVTTGEVKDQKMLDLLSKYGLAVTTKDGKKLNTPVEESVFLKITPETVPLIEIKDGATRDEKSRIHALLEKSQALVDRATLAKKIVSRLEIAALDLLELAKKDEGAQSLVDKYHIKQHAPSPSPSASASPSPAP